MSIHCVGIYVGIQLVVSFLHHLRLPHASSSPQTARPAHEPTNSSTQDPRRRSSRNHDVESQPAAAAAPVSWECRGEEIRI